MENSILRFCFYRWPEDGQRFWCWLIVGAIWVWGSGAIDASQSLGQDVNAGFGPTPGLSKVEIEDGWLSLFDGQTLFGWKATSDADWKAVDGEIRVASGTPGMLRTTSQFDDFELVVEFKSPKQTNSGIFLRTSPNPKNLTRDCYELNIASGDDHEFPTGSLVDRKKATTFSSSKKWRRYHIVADGPKIKIKLDGQRVLEYEDDSPLRRGYIGLQFKAGPVAFRNISLRPLHQESRFDGKSLKNWNTAEQRASKFEVTDRGELRILGGRGQLESDFQLGDFVFSIQAKTNAPGLNSGVFFRSIPGEFTNGYESQIQNQFVDGDRTKPVDCGTGGIFRRTNARRVNADDQQWFTKTIIATGPHIAVWVNGYRVTDWSDTRKPNANPRRGRRLEKGTIIFQGHDPGTDILLKNLRGRELMPRR